MAQEALGGFRGRRRDVGAGLEVHLEPGPVGPDGGVHRGGIVPDVQAAALRGEVDAQDRARRDRGA